MRDYPSLRFEKSRKKNASEFVFSEHIPVALSDDSVSDEDGDSIIKMHPSTNKITELYHTGLLVRQSIADHNYPKLPWPPGAVDFENSYLAAVPSSLYNILALIVGATDDVPSENQHLQLEGSICKKITSICEDIVYLASKGHSSRKHLSLGLTLKHLTGSSRVVNLINKYGHCASDETIRRYTTALALNRLQSIDQIPNGFSSGKSTILVWDNNDFSESTLTGAGTTHHTNGIMVQPSTIQSNNSRSIVPVSRRTRSLDPVDIEIQPFYLNVQEGPSNLKEPPFSLSDCKTNSADHRLDDFTYIGVKYVASETGESLPSWTDFNKLTDTNELLPKSAIHYLPVIEASPTQVPTVNHILLESIKHADRLNIETVTVVFDQAIYCNVQRIRWKDPELERRLVPRLGEFHTIMAFLGVIAKRYKLSGLDDIFIEAQLVAPGSLNGVMSGHNYNRSMRAHKIMFEALSILQLQGFLDTLTPEKQEHYSSLLTSTYESFLTSREVNMHPLKELQEEFTSYNRSQSESFPTYSFWSSYIEMVETMLLFVRATRESNWNLHLDMLRQMLPWYFAYDRYNYSR